jgi:predicted RNase H-like HicB family nuclease
MTTYYPIVIETETSGAVTAYVPGLPAFAAANTRTKVEQAIRETLASYLEAHPETVPTITP